ncbi:MAG TPA: hypothetical protein VIQ76_16025 [Propionibacteriaceae bacterium]|jgi:hypothetical protein
MTPGELLALFRTESRDLQSPYLWEDSEIYGYMNAAQEMFCRFTDGINDSTTSATQLTVTTGTPTVDLDPSLRRIRQARLLSTNQFLTILNPEDVELGNFVYDDYGIQRSSGIDLTATGTPRYLITGMDDTTARLSPIPIEDDTISMVVQRLPLVMVEGASDDLEVAERHHRYLLWWMQHLAHLKQDAEAYDRARSQMFRDMFQAYCAQVYAEQLRMQHKYRNMAYGGI